MPIQNAQHLQQEDIVCLSLEQMMDYLEGKHTPEMRARIDTHLEDCSFCRDAVDGLSQHPNRETVPSAIDALNEKIGAKASPARVQTERNWTKYYALAAMLLITVTASLFFMAREQPHEKLFAEYFSPYPLASQVRGEQASGGELALSAVKYEEGNYTEALAIFRAMLSTQPENMTVRFYAGVCYLALGDAENAISSFKAVLNSTETGLQEPAEWYLGLAYLKEPSEWYLGLAYLQNDDLENAESIFKKIASSQGFYKDKAEVILQALTR